MIAKAQVAALLDKKMDRQDFLKHVAVGLVAISGLSTALRALTPKQAAKQQSVSLGYGGSAYGGDKDGR